MNILVVDDHALFRDGLALLLRELDTDLAILHAGSIADAMARARESRRVDMVLLDLALPDESGLAGLSLLRAELEDVPVVVLSSSDDRDTVLQAIDRGAMGFIPKSATSAEMLEGLRVVLGRGVYVPPSVTVAAGPGRAGERDGARRSGTQAGPEPVTPAALGLTPRQADVLYQILQGKPIKLIARALQLSENTTKTHVAAVLRALNVTTRTQAVVVASQLGLRFPGGSAPGAGRVPPR